MSIVKDLGSLKYRSRFESRFADYLHKHKIKFKYEHKKFSYILMKFYLPDFYLEDYDIFIETKGRLTYIDRAKLLAVKKMHPDLDLRIIFMNARNKLNKRSKTTYGEWATKSGFKWSEGETIPKEWMK